MRAVNARLGLPAGRRTASSCVVRCSAASWTRDERHRRPALRPTCPPPIPAEYDSPRAQIARAKGLEAPYIAGGRDPDPEPGLARGALLREAAAGHGRGPHVRRASSSAIALRHRDRQRAAMTPGAAPVARDRRRRLGDRGRRGRRDAPRPDPDPVDQPAAARGARWRARRGAPDRGAAGGGRPRARGRRAGARPRLRPRPPARRRDRRRRRSCCCRISTSCPRRPIAGATTRSRPTWPTATSTAAARST